MPTQTRKKAAKAPAKAPVKIRMTKGLVAQAVRELEIKEKYNPGAYHVRMVGNRLEFHLLGGRVLVWPEDLKDEEE